MAPEERGKLWGGRFREPTHPSVERFSASIGFDRALARYDIRGSLAHHAVELHHVPRDHEAAREARREQRRAEPAPARPAPSLLPCACQASPRRPRDPRVA